MSALGIVVSWVVVSLVALPPISGAREDPEVEDSPMLEEQPVGSPAEATADVRGSARESDRESVEPPLAQEPGELFIEANRWYEAGEYGKAASAYEALIERGLGSAAVHYNLGNARLRGGQLGAAIASYRRARLRAPRDQDVDANLRFARSSARDALEPPGPGAMRRTLLFWHYALSGSEAVRVAILASLALFVAGSLMLRRPGSEPLRWCALAAGLLLGAVTGSLVCRWALPLRVAVVLPPEVEAFSGTDVDTVVRFRLHAGTEVRAAESNGEWVRIVLPSGEQGWIARDQVELVSDLR